VMNAWVTPGSSGISVGASGVSVTTPLYYIRTGQFTTRDLRRGPLVHHGPSTGHCQRVQKSSG
jgi:hypothetical protein